MHCIHVRDELNTVVESSLC